MAAIDAYTHWDNIPIGEHDIVLFGDRIGALRREAVGRHDCYWLGALVVRTTIHTHRASRSRWPETLAVLEARGRRHASGTA